MGKWIDCKRAITKEAMRECTSFQAQKVQKENNPPKLVINNFCIYIVKLINM
jgi:hypothetical protein